MATDLIKELESIILLMETTESKLPAKVAFIYLFFKMQQEEYET